LNDPITMRQTPERIAYAGYAILAVALILRLATVHFSPVSYRLYSDMGHYSNIADELLAGIWRPMHFFQPIGFPYIEYAFKRVFKDWAQAFGVYQSFITAASLWFMWKAAEMSFGRGVGLVALAVGSVHVQWLAFNLFAMSENTFAFLLSLLLWVSLRVVDRESSAWSALWGLVFIGAFWVKGTHLFVAPLFVLGILVWKRWSWPALTKIAVPISAVVLAGLLLHGLLAHRTIGNFQLSASAGGLNLVEGKCPAKINVDSTGHGVYSPLYTQLRMTDGKVWDRPFTDSSYFMREGLRCIEADPLVLVQSLENIPFLFIGNFAWPSNVLSVNHYVRLYELFFAMFLVTGLMVWLRSCWPVHRSAASELLVWAMPIVGLFICVYIFKSEIRFRVPFDVYFIPVAVQGWKVILAMNRLPSVV
jgi:hypothetical protein